MKWLMASFCIPILSVFSLADVTQRLNIATQDGTTCNTYPYKAIFPNANCTDNNDGTVSINITAGGGGSSSLETIFGTARSSPTATLKGSVGQFKGTVTGSTMTMTIDTSSMTAQGNIFNGANQLIEPSNAGTLGQVLLSQGAGNQPQYADPACSQSGSWTVSPGTGTYPITGTVTSNQGTAGTSFWGVDFSTGVKANQGTAGASAWKVDLTTGVGQGSAGSSAWKMDLSTGVGQGTAGTSAWLVDRTTATTVIGTLGNNGTAATTNRIGNLPAIAQDDYGNNGSAYTQGQDAAQMILTKSGLQGVWSGPDITFPSYSASTTTFAIVNSTSDIAALCGNASNIVMVYGLRVSCTQTTAGIIPISIALRSTAYTGNWSTMTPVSQDQNYTGAVSTAAYFTAQALTNGTLVGYVDTGQIGCMAAATATPNDIYISPSAWKMKPIVLRGVAQCLGINLQGATITGGKYTVSFDWMEVVSP